PILHLFINHTPTPEIYTLSLHDALPIFDIEVMTTLTASERGAGRAEITSPVIADPMLFRILQGLFSRLERWNNRTPHARPVDSRSEEHTSELQSRFDLVCRLLLEKKK